ncbi:DTWD2, partial [Symbiodinium necroappetens]
MLGLSKVDLANFEDICDRADDLIEKHRFRQAYEQLCQVRPKFGQGEPATAAASTLPPKKPAVQPKEQVEEELGKQSEPRPRHPAAQRILATLAFCSFLPILTCDVLPSDRPLWTRTRIVILVHPKEIKRKLGTLPLLRLCLQDLVIREGEHFPEPSEDPELHELLAEGGHQPMFLCPGPDAKELAPVETSTTDPVEDASDLDTKASLIFIDGTWRQAKGMVMRSPWLREHVPRAVIRPSGHSGYRFRKQPEQGCLSTVEAVAEALWALEGHRGAELKSLLLAPFHRMVELQCTFIRALEDKNAPVEQTRLLFDPEAALKALGESPATEASSDGAKGQWQIAQPKAQILGEVIVMDVLRGNRSSACTVEQPGNIGAGPSPNKSGNQAGAAPAKGKRGQEKSGAGTGGGKYLCRVKVGIEEDYTFQVCRRIIGPGGENMK